jgi:hypothetical protein
MHHFSLSPEARARERRCVHRVAHRGVPGIDLSQIQLGDGTDNEAGKMIGGQRLSYGNCLFESGFVIWRFESSSHVANLLH